ANADILHSIDRWGHRSKMQEPAEEWCDLGLCLCNRTHSEAFRRDERSEVRPSCLHALVLILESGAFAHEAPDDDVLAIAYEALDGRTEKAWRGGLSQVADAGRRTRGARAAGEHHRVPNPVERGLRKPDRRRSRWKPLVHRE